MASMSGFSSISLMVFRMRASSGRMKKGECAVSPANMNLDPSLEARSQAPMQTSCSSRIGSSTPGRWKRCCVSYVLSRYSRMALSCVITRPSAVMSCGDLPCGCVSLSSGGAGPSGRGCFRISYSTPSSSSSQRTDWEDEFWRPRQLDAVSPQADDRNWHEQRDGLVWACRRRPFSRYTKAFLRRGTAR